MTTNRKQTKRLLIAGYPGVTLRMDGHRIVLEPVPLYRLWDDVHGLLPKKYEFSTDLTSIELVEVLVEVLESHYNGQGTIRETQFCEG